MNKTQYSLRRNIKSLSIRISVKAGGEVVVSAPKLMPVFIINKFVETRRDWIKKSVEKMKKVGPTVRVSKAKKRSHYLENKEAARALATERLLYWNQFYNFTYHKISIRDQSTRWGSCSRHGNLNFSYKIALIPEHLSDYIVVHELCHLGQFNHSQKFWDLVARTIPDYKKRVSELKKTNIEIK